MKRKLFLTLVLTAIMVLFLTTTVFAQDAIPEADSPAFDWLNFVLGLGSLGGLIGFAVDQIIKRVLPNLDGKAPQIVALLNVALMLVVGLTDFFGFPVNWLAIDGAAGLILEIAKAILGLFSMQMTAFGLHSAGRGSFLSNSFSAKKK